MGSPLHPNIRQPTPPPPSPREDYVAYERMCGYVTSLSSKLQSLPPSSPFRIDLIDLTDQLLTKLYNLGVIDGKGSLEKADRVSVSGFCRRRLPVVMVRLKMSQTLQAAITLIETGQVRMEPTDGCDGPGDAGNEMLVTRGMEDFVGWTEGGKIERSVKKYSGKLDDLKKKKKRGEGDPQQKMQLLRTRTPPHPVHNC